MLQAEGERERRMGVTQAQFPRLHQVFLLLDKQKQDLNFAGVREKSGWFEAPSKAARQDQALQIRSS